MAVGRYGLDGKRVLVTGGGTGIGAAIAGAFRDQGARVVVTGRRRGPLDEVAGRAAPGEGVAIEGDVSSEGGVRAIVDAAIAALGGLDVVVSNAGAYAGGELSDLAVDDWERMRAVNVDGLFHLARAVQPHLVGSGGCLVAVSSVSGLRGDWGQAAYNATKHAVTGFVMSLALDWGARGVRVNAVAPAFTRTEMTAGMDDLAPFVNRIALGRPGEPEDVAPAVLFLASDDAAYITGAVLPVDGGTSASTGQPHV